MPAGNTISIYTDGSCHTQLQTGCWAAIILYLGREFILKEVVTETTHNRMELLAVIHALEYIVSRRFACDELLVYSDSQYVVGLAERKPKLLQRNFMTASGKPVRNHDLVKRLYTLISSLPVQFLKVKAHQKKTEKINYNRKVDKLVRKTLRAALMDNE